MRIPCLPLAIALIVQSPAAGAQPVAATSLAATARPAAGVVDQFHAALARGDTARALALLSDDALIYEGGRVERSKSEYAAHHLGADAAFSKSVPRKLTRRTGRVVGNLAWIASEARSTGTFRGRTVDSIGTETMVLRRRGSVWRIVHIHWSARDAEG